MNHRFLDTQRLLEVHTEKRWLDKTVHSKRIFQLSILKSPVDTEIVEIRVALKSSRGHICGNCARLDRIKSCQRRTAEFGGLGILQIQNGIRQLGCNDCRNFERCLCTVVCGHKEFDKGIRSQCLNGHRWITDAIARNVALQEAQLSRISCRIGFGNLDKLAILVRIFRILHIGCNDCIARSAREPQGKIGHRIES